jgi:hypothetical protein
MPGNTQLEAISEIFRQNPLGVTYRRDDLENYIGDFTGISPQWSEDTTRVENIVAEFARREEDPNYTVDRFWGGYYSFYRFPLQISGGSIYTGEYNGLRGNLPNIFEIKQSRNKKEWYVQLTFTEALIMDLLSQYTGQEVEAEHVALYVSKVSGSEFQLRALMTHVSRLRSKFAPNYWARGSTYQILLNKGKTYAWGIGR